MRKVFIIILFSIFACACSSRSNSSKQSSPSHSTDNHYDASSSEDHVDEESDNSSSQGNTSVEDNDNRCKFEDGTYSASVDYYNPETNYSATYTLDVAVQDCQVIEIEFSQGGWLDEDHITAAELDEDGNASVEGENGKTYDVHIDNQ